MGKTSRREFVRNVSLGAVGTGLAGMARAASPKNTEKGREVWIAALTQHQIKPIGNT